MNPMNESFIRHVRSIFVGVAELAEGSSHKASLLCGPRVLSPFLDFESTFQKDLLRQDEASLPRNISEGISVITTFFLTST
jgi:hypothetical protein